ncbi:MAG: proteasome subunit beta [candidate division NC10 bacterium]|nr:proteasome subunit beta [candidate division NC10 bacterium]
MKDLFSANLWGSSFYDLLASSSPSLLPRLDLGGVEEQKALASLPRGTTVLALRYRDGVVIAGDRLATEGYQVAGRRIEKVYKADEHSAIAIAGVAGPCLELVHLFQTELEHYEKLEGVELSTEGKANKLTQMIKANFPFALQGLVVIPIFAGYDTRRGEGKIYKYDLTGGRYEETDYHATGSGGREARATLKRLYKKDMSEEEALRAALEALLDASEEDLGTAGPDFLRDIYPTTKRVTREGITDVEEDRVKALYQAIMEERRRA